MDPASLAQSIPADQVDALRRQHNVDIDGQVVEFGAALLVRFLPASATCDLLLDILDEAGAACRRALASSGDAAKHGRIDSRSVAVVVGNRLGIPEDRIPQAR